MLPTSPRPATGRAALAALALAVLPASLGTSIANIGLPALATAFHADFQSVQWVVLAYLLAMTLAVVSAGRLGDLLGRRRLLLAGCGVFGLASLLCGAAPQLPWLLAARALQGLGAAVMLTLSMAMVGEAVPKARTGSAMGLLATMSAIGTALGPALGGVLLAALGWRALFWVNVPLAALAALLAWRTLPADATRSPTRLGWPGTLLLAATLAAYALAMTLGHGRLDARNGALLLAAALGGLLLWQVERRTSAPLLPLATLRQPPLRAALLLSALVMTVMMATLVVGPFYLAGALGLPPAQVGAVMAAGPLLSVLTGLLAGKVVDRLGSAVVMRSGLLLMLAGTLLLALQAATWGVAGYLAAIVVLTPGYQAFQAANNTAVMADAAASQRGVLSGLLNLARNLGLITGAACMGALFAHTTGSPNPVTAPAASIAAGLHGTFAVGSGLLLIALLVAQGGWRRAATPAQAPAA
ncbi:Predicted arabinose efflux permease, MFS family [Andreprevotia lacus DSM 23236]|uniref:Predicted arabinose efflux permease, MFS family n=1 Tax=Andreprevotia lacus DSM 23236 TaxID=1121001 RepID=A0A1W1X8C3_9NEIS|nr:MFS transporter [Andreprevotia lacus]SMC20169.1 Predicted arabinose efflux permease, MFS family [Andreprevotia lacus DSM 23236]